MAEPRMLGRCPGCDTDVRNGSDAGVTLWLGYAWHSTCIPQGATGRADLRAGYSLAARARSMAIAATGETPEREEST